MSGQALHACMQPLRSIRATRFSADFLKVQSIQLERRRFTCLEYMLCVCAYFICRRQKVLFDVGTFAACAFSDGRLSAFVEPRHRLHPCNERGSSLGHRHTIHAQPTFKSSDSTPNAFHRLATCSLVCLDSARFVAHKLMLDLICCSSVQF